MPVSVEPFTGPLRQLESLVAAWRFKPYRWIVDQTPEALRRLVLGRIEDNLRRDDVRAWVAFRDGELRGIAILEPLPWDSRVIDIPSAKCEFVCVEDSAIVNALLDAALAEAARDRLRHISVRVDAGDDPAVHALERRGFLNVDALLTFEAAVADLPQRRSAATVSLRTGNAADAAAVGEIAAHAFVHGRFHSDPSLTRERAGSVYRTWAEECCRGTAADHVLVAAAGGDTVGFVACRMQRDTAVHLKRPTGTISLIASDESMRGAGIGTMLVSGAAEWFRNEGAVAVGIGTQLRNVVAARLYERCGFRLVSGAMSFRTMIS
jgi:ribosomal protein S18 acetylase RimI-like enzyme